MLDRGSATLLKLYRWSVDMIFVCFCLFVIVLRKDLSKSPVIVTPLRSMVQQEEEEEETTTTTTATTTTTTTTTKP